MQEVLVVWLICVLAGTSCAIFYTKSVDTDYPRMGKRAFFTGGIKGSNYPRIGRRSDSSFSGGDPSLADLDNDVVLQQTKRGFFTTGGGGYPRVGRRGDARHGADLAQSSAVMTSVEAPDVALGSGEQTHYQLPLGLLFFDFDKNGDKSLTREEFVEGVARVRAEGALC